MSSPTPKEFIAKDRLDLPYEPGTIFCRAFFYFNENSEDFLMVTGSEVEILTFAEKELEDKIYLMTLHKCPKYKEDNRDNLISFHLPQIIIDAGVAAIVTKRKKDVLEIPQGTQTFGKFNPNHYYRFIGTLSHKETQNKVLIASYKHLPRAIPAIVQEWIYEAFVSVNNQCEKILAKALEYPKTLPTQECIDDIENYFSDDEDIGELFNSIIGA